MFGTSMTAFQGCWVSTVCCMSACWTGKAQRFIWYAGSWSQTGLKITTQNTLGHIVSNSDLTLYVPESDLCCFLQAAVFFQHQHVHLANWWTSGSRAEALSGERAGNDAKRWQGCKKGEEQVRCYWQLHTSPPLVKNLWEEKSKFGNSASNRCPSLHNKVALSSVSAMPLSLGIEDWTRVLWCHILPNHPLRAPLVLLLWQHYDHITFRLPLQ